MTGTLPQAAFESLFRDDEPIVQSHALLPGAEPPLFGNTEILDFNGVIRRPANRSPGKWKILLGHLPEPLNLLVREMAMVWFNPRHPAVLARGIHLSPTPRAVSTVIARSRSLRHLARFGTDHGLGLFTFWSDDDFKAYLSWRHDRLEKDSSTEHVTVIKDLHRFAPVLSHSGLARDPWPGMSAQKVMELSVSDELSTPAIPPETWFPLVRAAWIYINVFSPDILRAMNVHQDMRRQARKVDVEEGGELLTRWLSVPSNRVPVHPPGRRGGTANWNLLTWMIGACGDSANSNLLRSSTAPGRERRRQVEAVIAQGRTQTGLIPHLTEVDRPDGTRGSWHPNLLPRDLWLERTALRNACYIFTIALSMMRDSEVREVTKTSVVDYYSNPALKATKRKRDADLPSKHWWIISQVAQAVDVAAQLSLHPDLAFAAVNEGEADASFLSQKAINSFIKHVNSNRHHTGLAEIPVTSVTPHMFRRTMAMLTRDYPGSEIAVGMQLKHVATRALANRSTQGYMAKDPAWSRHLNDAIAERRFERVKEMFLADGRGENIGFGPAAERMRETFQSVRNKAEELRANGMAQRGDVRVEFDLLRRTRLTIRFGKLNHCTLDESNPVGAKCLEDTVIPEGHKGPLPDRCRPSRCANSIIGPAHLPIWRAEHSSLTRLLGTPKIPRNRKAQLQEQIRDVEAALKKADQT
ncbi:hypothetical protein OG402_38255 [Streptomyces anulatus]|uniref:hypothetical protein n=1 Tax=Streptomyces anulatus TaxID=1892 RepID=UPI00224ED377|nr:hypothetical protein [Streptomyces anulatus]MCX4523283.1 hypothetical protein [Streptomyces anulatus]MCX4606294.1 hypothetical protein [Streptomyces anulatus]WSU78220.1 hypothetical protein OG499_37075 [Streptomyces anulatus]